MPAMQRIAKRVRRPEEAKNATRRAVFRAHRRRCAALVMLQHPGAPRALPDELGRLSYGYHMSDLYQGALIMTHRDGLPRFSARSVGCGDAGHHKARATPSEGPRMRSLWVIISAP